MSELDDGRCPLCSGKSVHCPMCGDGLSWVDLAIMCVAAFGLLLLIALGTARP